MNEVINIKKLQTPVVTQVSSCKVSYVRNAVGYALVYILLSAVVSYLLNVTIIPGDIVLSNVLVPSLCYLILGLLFAAFMYSKLSYLDKLSLSGGFRYTIIVCACIFLVSLLIGNFKGNGSVLTSLFYSSLFLIPFTVFQTWLFYKSIYVAGHGKNKIWYLPEPTGKAPVATVFLNSIRIKIKVSPIDGATEKTYETTVPGRITIGNMFTNFIHYEANRYSDEVNIKDVNNRLYGWMFSSSSFMGLNSRPLNPDLSLYENGIKDDTIIAARRIQKQFM